MQSAKANAEPTKFILADGTTALLLETDGNQVVFTTETPAPPGARLALLHGTDEHFSAKVQRCRKLEADGKFRIEARFIDLSREQRTKLLALCQV